MGLLGIPLDLNNLLISSIALGIAVDDAIHFLHHFGAARARPGAMLEDAIREARHHAGRAMFATSALLITGLGVYFAAVNVAVQRFGLLTGATVLAALLVDLTVLPAILRVAYRNPRPSRADSGADV